MILQHVRNQLLKPPTPPKNLGSHHHHRRPHSLRSFRFLVAAYYSSSAALLLFQNGIFSGVEASSSYSSSVIPKHGLYYPAAFTMQPSHRRRCGGDGSALDCCYWNRGFCTTSTSRSSGMTTFSLPMISSSSSSSLNHKRKSKVTCFSSLLNNHEKTSSVTTTTPTASPVSMHGTLHNVIVKRNKQSKMFREGSPLVFSGALECTYQLLSNNHDEEEQKQERVVELEEEGGGVPMGAFVSVSVSNSKPEKSSSNSRRGGGGGGKGRRGGKNNNQEKKSSTYPHLHLPTQDTLLSSSSSQIIGYGIYNPNSMYRVRILCHQYTHPTTFHKISSVLKKKKDHDEQEEGVKEAIKILIKDKLIEAIQTRRALKLPSSSSSTTELETDTYRLINGEGDGLSGLAMDILGGKVVVIMSSASWCEIYKDVIMRSLEEILEEEEHLVKNGKDMDVVWRNTRSRLEQDGYYKQSNFLNQVVVNAASSPSKDEERKDDDDDDKEEEEEKHIILTENSIKYKSYPYSQSSQKTGFYCDQRQNRHLVSQYTSSKNVLDLCCYSGGFAISAMKLGGAKYCCGVDSSMDAVNMAIENSRLNGLKVVSEDGEEGEKEGIEFIREDVAKFMKDKLEQQQQQQQSSTTITEYDVIILDPPKLSPSTSALERASRKYHSLNRDAIKLINSQEGGLLLTCTCSGAMTQKDGGQYFLNMVKNAALAAGRRVTLLEVSGAASCHVRNVASYPAGDYLTAAFFHVSPVG